MADGCALDLTTIDDNCSIIVSLVAISICPVQSVSRAGQLEQDEDEEEDEEAMSPVRWSLRQRQWRLVGQHTLRWIQQ